MSPQPRLAPPNPALSALAALNVVLHLLGLAFTVLALRRGTSPEPLESRLAYLRSASWDWSLGWAVWMLCAIALVAFLAALVPRFEPAPARLQLAVALAAAGAAVDLACDTVHILLAPRLAAAAPPGPEVLLVVEQAAGGAGLVAANGLYSLAVALATWALRDRAGLGLAATGLGYLCALSGLCLATQAFASGRLLPLLVPATILTFSAWTVAVATGLRAPLRRR